MSVLRLALVAAALAASLSACSGDDGNYYGYGYAANERPSLAQLGAVAAPAPLDGAAAAP